MPAYVLVALLAAAAAALMALAVRIMSRFRRDPREREKRRRLSVNLHGRLADGTITEVSDSSIFYTYSVGGVIYAASQDIAELQSSIPFELEKLVGCPVTVKYVSRNPANSIVLCEDWSGLRAR